MTKIDRSKREREGGESGSERGEREREKNLKTESKSTKMSCLLNHNKSKLSLQTKSMFLTTH